MPPQARCRYWQADTVLHSLTDVTLRKEDSHMLQPLVEIADDFYA